MRRHDGEYRWMLSKGKPMYDLDGNYSSYLGTSFEIHDERMIARELEMRVKERTHALQQTNQNLEHTNSELKQFAYVASHDLQEPLRKIQTFSDLLQKVYGEKVKGKVTEYIEKVVQSAQRMSMLINDLLEYSGATNPSQEFRTVDLNETVQEVLKDFDLDIRERKAKIKTGTLPKVEGVPVQMKQLFTNLLSNALKFARPRVRPEISIQGRRMKKEETGKYPLSESRAYYDITVSDNGIGFKAEYADQVFVIFQRLNSDRLRYPGTGIGLALCKKIVMNHNGIIYADSSVSKGTTFHIILPVEE